ncbi:hypothetical protein CAEBREN_18231 [Caenorhabditis brenneri]|uniref:Uncharacterized protein n=1 Tax=Caenorhabditis brenneri TaxID=135651 RepID=G0N290_CAEBE|nr:hypothetical protein CAEBREN_18231 [Caenorhabditis brenneri]
MISNRGKTNTMQYVGILRLHTGPVRIIIELLSEQERRQGNKSGTPHQNPELLSDVREDAKGHLADEGQKKRKYVWPVDDDAPDDNGIPVVEVDDEEFEDHEMAMEVDDVDFEDYHAAIDDGFLYCRIFPLIQFLAVCPKKMFFCFLFLLTK